MNEGLVTSLNAIREASVSEGTIYHQYVPAITDDTNIATFGSVILSTPVVANEFMNRLVNRIVYTSFETKYFNNPLQVLEGDRIPLGYLGQEIYVNPAKRRKYDVDDFAGLLVKYEADVKVQYTQVNMDLQYPVTVSRHKLKQAFVSWEALDSFIQELSNSLYNGAYIDEYNFTKGLVSSAYKANRVQIQTLTTPSDEATGKAFVKKLRELFLNMKAPSSSYNAWAKVGGYGNEIITWSNPEDIVLLLRNDVASNIDVDVLASAFNIDKATLLGNIIYVNNFNMYNDDGSLNYDGSKILGFIGDKSWFRIKRQDMFLDEFYNANNRTWQYYLNLTKLYNYSLFSNGVCICTEAPVVPSTAIKFIETTPTVVAEEKITLHIETTPFEASDTITFSSGTVGKATVEKIDNRTVEVTGVASGTSVITATNGTVSGTVTVTVTSGS